jgi:hypothetical protein
MNKSQKKINLIYITSNGRSGSTMLEEVLSNHQKIMTFGELQEVIHSYIPQGRPCSCGVNVHECNFWKPLKKKILNMKSLKKFRIHQGQGKVIRLKELIKIFFNFKVNLKDPYVKENYELFKTLDELNRNENYFIDSSKDPYRLHYLSSIKNLNIIAIHIFKNPKAYVYSLNKKGKKSFIRYLKSILRYNIENKIIRYVIKKNNLKQINIFYDNFCNDTEKEIKKIIINPYFNLNDKNENSILTSFKRSKTNKHAIAGNSMRKSFNEIQYDDKWKNDNQFIQSINMLVNSKIFKLLKKER